MSIFSDTNLLNPKFSRACRRLHQFLIDAHETGRTKTRFEIFETYRTPMRQADVLKKGSSTAGAFQSAHQFGLACDFVPYLSSEEAVELSARLNDGTKVKPGWNWHASHDYRFLATAAQQFGLSVPITWDPCHVEHPKWRQFRLAYANTFE